MKWRSKLQQKYRGVKSKIRFGACRDAIADTDDLFVDLELLEDRGSSGMSPKGRTELHSTGRKLKSYEELLTVTDRDMEPSHHVLICGNAGSGKTTLISRIAYEWAKSEDDGKTDSQPVLASTLNQMTLVFVLDIHKFSSDETISMAIKRQVLSSVSVDDIENVLSILQKDCLLLLDGYDEMRKGTVNHVLEDEILSECFVIVTTRMHKVDHFCVSQTEKYSIVKLSGFSHNNSFKYVKKFFSQEYFRTPELAQTLVQHICETPFLATLSSFPILLLMICLLWTNLQKKTTKALNSMTNLYQEALTYLNKPFDRKSKVLDDHDLLTRLGKPALANLFENNLRISQKEFDCDILEHAFQMGVLFREEGLLVNDASVVFIHKTFQEYFAAVYLASLVEINREKFNAYLNYIDKNNVDEMECLLKFCCGQSVKAAEAILVHVVDLMCRPNNSWDPLQLPLILLHEAELSQSANTDASRALQTTIAPVMEKHAVRKIQSPEVLNVISFCTMQPYQQGRWLNHIRELICTRVSINIDKLIHLLHGLSALEKLQIGNMHIKHNVKLMDDENSLNVSLLAYILPIASLAYISPIASDNFDIRKITTSSASPLCRALRKLQVMHSGTKSNKSTIKLISLLKLLFGMLLVTVTLNGIALTEVDVSLSLSYELLQELHLKKCSMSTNTMMRLLDCTPAVMALTLDETELTDEVDVSISPSCESLQEYTMMAVSASLDIVIHLLKCMSAVELTIEEVVVRRTISGRISPYKSQQELRVRGFSVSANMIMRLLDCTPTVKTLTLDRMELTDKVGVSISPSCKSVKECTMMAVSTSLDMVIQLLNISVVKLTIEEVEVRGTIGGRISFYKSQQELRVRGFSVSANMIMRLLYCTPVVTTLTLNGIKLTGEVDDSISPSYDGSISPSCKLQKKIQMNKCSMSANMMMRLLDCLPAVTTLTLNETELVGEVDDSISPSCKSLQECTMMAVSASLDMVIHLLKCMSAVKLTIKEVAVRGTSGGRISLYKSLQELEMKGFSVSVNMMMRLLDCTPAVTTLALDEMKLTGEVDESISCKSLQELQMKKCSMSANTMMRLLDCAPVVTTLTLDGTDLTGELVDYSISPSCVSLKECSMMAVSAFLDMVIQRLKCISAIKLTIEEVRVRGGKISLYKSQQELQMRGFFVSANMMMRLLDCTPAITTLALDEMKLTGEVDESISCKSLQELQMKKCSMSANTMMRLLDCAPVVTTLTLDGTDLTGELVDVSISPPCESLQECTMMAVSASLDMVIHLLKCMSAVKLTIKEVVVRGTIRGRISLYKSQQELQMKRFSVSAIKMMRLLDCTPTVTTFILDEMKLTGEVDDSISPSCKSVKEFQMKKCSMSANTIMRLLDCTPAVTTLTLDGTDLTGELVDGSISPSCESLKECSMMAVSAFLDMVIQRLKCISAIKLTIEEVRVRGGKISLYKSQQTLEMRGFFVSANMMMKLLNCIPAVTTLALDAMELTGEVDENISSCKLLQELQMKKCSMSANTLIRLLGCMPSVTTLTLDRMHLTDDPGKPEHDQWGCVRRTFISGITIQILLSCMPSITKLTLNGFNLVFNVDKSLRCESLQEFRMEDCSQDTNTMMGLLSCMQVVKTVTLDRIHLTDEPGEPEHDQWDLVRRTISGITIQILLSCLPSIIKLTLNGFNLVGNVDKSLRCQSLQELQMKNCCQKTNTMMELLSCMPSVTKLTLYGFDLVGNVDKSLRCESLQEFQMKQCSQDTNTIMMGLLSCMPSVTKLTLKGFYLVGNVGKSLQCESLQEFKMGDCTQETNTMMGLLSCMQVVKTVTLDRIHLTDEPGKPEHDLLGRVRRTFISGITIQILLSRIPSITKLTLIGFNLVGNVDKSLQCESLQEFQMKQCSQDTNTMMGLLSCMQVVKTVTLDRIHLTDEPGKPEHDPLGRVRRTFISGITIQILLSCIPSITKLTLKGFHLVANVDKSLQCESLQEFQMKQCTQEKNTMMGLLSCMPSITTLTLDRIHLTDEPGEPEYYFMGYVKRTCIRTATLQRLLSCISSVTNVTLVSMTLQGNMDILPQDVIIEQMED